MSSPKRSPKWSKSVSPFLVTGLLVTGNFHFIPQVLALGTTAGTNINNRATATYTDPANPGTPLNAESNTVVVTVAEVGGLTNVPAGIVDENLGSINSNDVVNYDFLLTNTGNSENDIEIPRDSITNPDGNLTVSGFLLDLNNDGDFDDPGESLGNDGSTPFTTDQTAANIPADDSVRVRVVTTVNAGLGAGAPVAIRLGSTDDLQTGQDPTEENVVVDAAQNQDYTNNGGTEVSTTSTAPVNGRREAASLQSSATSLSVTPLALAQVEKTRSAYAPNTPATNDDQITYRLDFEVASTSPDPTSFTPANLEGTTIRLSPNADGSAPLDVQRILVSDAIPADTSLTSFAPTAPTGWRVVYTDDTVAAATPVVGGLGQSSVVWTTAVPSGGVTSVTRIGWIYVGPSNVADTTVAGPTLAPGVTTSGDANGFQFQVVTSGLTANGNQEAGTIANIAQAFGETVGDPNDEVVYDESGDDNPNNFNDDDTPPDPTGSDYDPADDTGEADPGTQGTDNNNDNTGTGEEGEANVISITPAGAILNGPLNQPGAVGPNDNNDDFVNQSSLLVDDGNPATTSTTVFTATPGQIFDPEPIVFDNTFQNPPSNSSDLDTVRLLPLPPNTPSVTATTPAQEATDIPDGTIITITVGASSAQYSYDDATGYTYLAASGTGPNFDPGPNTLRFDNVNPGVSIDYTVTIDLPAGSQLSADRFTANGSSRAGYSVPIVAFVDNNNSGAFETANDNVFNIKIDRLYLGHLSLLKEQQVLNANGTVDTAFTTNPITDVEPGQFIEYRISYVNFSTPSPSGGSGNVTLGISNLVITEDGTTGTLVPGAAGTANNWALPLTAPVTTHQQNTVATQGTLQFFNEGTDLGSLDPTTGATVTRYVNSVGTLDPDDATTANDASTYQGSFTFRRVLN